MFNLKSSHLNLTRTLMVIEKRTRFVLSAILMTLIMLFSTFFSFNTAWIFVPFLIVISYIVTYVSILEGIKKIEWFMLFLMPIYLAVCLYLFYYLFPVRWITRVPFLLVYGISYYAILLTSNIFNVGVEKNIQLHRAAFSVNYFYQTLILFLLSNVLFSFKLDFFFNGIVILVATLLLSIQLLWSVKPELLFNIRILQFGFLISFIVSQMTIVLSFTPIAPSIFALFLTASYYGLIGILYHHLDGRLFKQTIQEYAIVFGFVMIVLLLSFQW